VMIILCVFQKNFSLCICVQHFFKKNLYMYSRFFSDVDGEIDLIWILKLPIYVGGA
jgi:hypothetical protein